MSISGRSLHKGAFCTKGLLSDPFSTLPTASTATEKPTLSEGFDLRI